MDLSLWKNANFRLFKIDVFKSKMASVLSRRTQNTSFWPICLKNQKKIPTFRPKTVHLPLWKNNDFLLF